MLLVKNRKSFTEAKMCDGPRILITYTCVRLKRWKSVTFTGLLSSLKTLYERDDVSERVFFSLVLVAL